MEKRITLDYASPRPPDASTSALNWMIERWLTLWRWLFARPRVYLILAVVACCESILWQLKHNPFSFLCSLIAMVTWPVLLVTISKRQKRKNAKWRLAVVTFFVLSIAGNVGLNRCPHAVYVVVGDRYWVIEGKECGNGGNNIPFARKLWITWFGTAGDYYGWTAG